MHVLLSISISKPCCCCCCCCFIPQLGDDEELLSLVGVLVEEELFKSGEVAVASSFSEVQPDSVVVTPAAEAAPESHGRLSSVLLPWRLED